MTLASPSARKQAGLALRALVLGILVIAAMSLAAAPLVGKQRQLVQMKECVRNLSDIESAKEHIALEKDLKPGAPMTMADLIKHGKTLTRPPVCPSGGTYGVQPFDTAPTCTVPGHRLP